MNRREFLSLAALPLETLTPTLERGSIQAQPEAGQAGSVIGLDGTRIPSVDVISEWSGPVCRSRIVNRGASAVRVKEIVVLSVPLALPPAATLYGEGFQMLTQTAGTVGSPTDLSQYTDASHYKIPAPAGSRAYYGLVTLTPPGEDTVLFAFTSCARFSGRFQVETLPAAPGGRPTGPPASSRTRYRISAVLDAEGLELRPGETWNLEELVTTSGRDRAQLLADVATRLGSHHPPLRLPGPRQSAKPPTGWCSWYCFGPRVTARQVLDNLDVIAKSMPSLKYVQIDDGYQSAMGDWLDTGAAFGGNVRSVLEQIRRKGFEPAIWVAPFVAEESSKVFKEHPDWFVKDAAGAPLRSDRVTFGGWRRGPWYALDGTHPQVQQHLERLFRTMRTNWGCTYFKLDANFWGAIHGGRFSDPRATRVEAYRRGMSAIVRGAGSAFLLGCNHPIWPSIGLIHGSRSSNDIRRSWDRVASTARQNLSRNWQNGRLWWNDPDAVVVSGELSEAEAQFHATVIFASGGMVLSGDDLTTIPAPRAALLRKLLPPTGVAAEFEDETLSVGVVRLPNARVFCLFNWGDAPKTLSVRLPRASTVTDHWTGALLGRRQGTMPVEMRPRSARLLRVV